MIQTLLADRFRLAVHRETRQVPVYVLTVSKGGPKLHPFKEGSCVGLDPNELPATPPRGQICRTIIGITAKGNWQLKMSGGSFDELLQRIGLALNRPVLDRTGMKGTFDAQMEFAVDEHTPLPGGGNTDAIGAGPEPAAPSIFTVIQQQL